MEAQAWTNLLTAGMALATVWLAIETRKMAVAAKDSIDLQGRPYLSLAGIYLTVGTLQNLTTIYTGAVRIGIRLKNPGKVLIYYHVPNIAASFGGHVPTNPTFDSRGGVIHPDEEIIFYCPLIETPTPLVPPSDGEIEFRVTYWSAPSDRKNLRAKVRVVLNSPSTHEWSYLEGPSYT